MKKIISLFFVFLSITFNAQLLWPNHQSHDKTAIEEISKKYASAKNPQDLNFIIHTYLKKFPAENSTSADIISAVFIAKKTADEKEQLNNISSQLFENAISKARKLKRNDLEVWVSLHYGFYLYTYRKYKDSFPYFMFCINNLEQTADENVIQIDETYKKTAYFLTTNLEYEKAVKYLLKAKKYTIPESSEMASLTDALGVSSLRLEKPDDAEKYFNSTIAIARKNKDELRLAKGLGNLAEVHLYRKNYNSAIDLLEQDILISDKLGNDQNTMYALILLSKVLLAKGDLKNAEENIRLAEKYSKSKSYFKSSNYEINQLLLELAKKTGNDAQELYARRNLENLRDSLKMLDGKEVITEVNWATEKNYLQLEIDAEKSKREKESYFKIAAILVSFLLIIIIFFIIKSYRNTISLEKTNYEKKVLTLLLDKIKSENKLNATHQTIESYRTYLSEKNKQIEKLEFEIDKVRHSSSSYLEKKSGEMQKLLESHLMTQENWENFKEAYMNEYPEEYSKLQTDFPDLTDSNLRIIILSRLEMTNNEMSRILGVTVDAVKKAKQRLRKKYENRLEDLLPDK